MALVKLNNRGVRSVTDFGGTTALGTYTFIKKVTASSSGTVSFVHGTSDVVLDGTYKEYLFTLNNIHPSVSEADLSFNMSTDSGSNYNVAKTTTRLSVYHKEDDSGTPAITYHASSDLGNGTGFQDLFQNIGIENYESSSGYLQLFDPSNTTYVKHFMARGNIAEASDYTEENYTSGYGNTTSAINAVQFKMDSGNIDAGDICLYGIN
jgi:hypothetical protein